MRKVLFFLWGGIYWPFMLIGLLFMGLSELFGGIGAWLHDLLVDWAFPPQAYVIRDGVPVKSPCACGAFHTGPCLPERIS